MVWINITQIPNDVAFYNIIDNFVINCPSCEKKVTRAKGQGKKIEYKPVSVRNSTFRSRGITGNMFVTLLAQIRKPLMKNGTYVLLNNGGIVETTVNTIISNVSLGDPYFDFIVYQEKSEMTDLETLFYYIRNAFAHGSFEVINTKGGRVYKLESAKNNMVKARMRLKESTLYDYIRYSLLDAQTVKALQTSRVKKKVSPRVKIEKNK